MAPKTKIFTNNALTRRKHARDLFRIVLPDIEFNQWIGGDHTAIVHECANLAKGEGDTITFGIRLPIGGDVVIGDDVVEGTEAPLSFKDFKMTIEEFNKAVDTGGKMEKQRIPYNLATEGKSALQEYISDMLSDFLINTLMANSKWRMPGATDFFANEIYEPETGHYLAINQADGVEADAAERLITSADAIDLSYLDRLKQRAENPVEDCWKVRPVKMKGKSKYMVLMHKFAFDAMKDNINVAQLGDLRREAKEYDVPFADFHYNDMFICNSSRVPQITKSGADGRAGAYRVGLYGAQAACLGWGGAGDSQSSEMSFKPYKKDADRFLMFRAGAINGIQRTFFTINGKRRDYGCVLGSAWAAPKD